MVQPLANEPTASAADTMDGTAVTKPVAVPAAEGSAEETAEEAKPAASADEKAADEDKTADDAEAKDDDDSSSDSNDSDDEEIYYPQVSIQDAEGNAGHNSVANNYVDDTPSDWQYSEEDEGKGDARFDPELKDKSANTDAKDADAEAKKGEDEDDEDKPKALTYRVLDEMWNQADYRWQIVHLPKGNRSDHLYAFCIHRRLVPSGAAGMFKVMIRVLSQPLGKVLQKLVAPHDRLYESVPFLPINHIYASKANLESWLAHYDAEHKGKDGKDASAEPAAAVAVGEEPATEEVKENADAEEAKKKKEELPKDAQATLELLNKLSTEQLAEAAEGVRDLLTFLHDEFADTVRKYNELIADGLITYDLLWLMFNVGDEVVFPHQAINQSQLMKVTEVRYVPTDGEDPAYLAVQGETLEWSGTHFFTHQVRRGITQFSGPRPIHELSLQLRSRVAESVQATMAARGRRYAALTGVHYKSYRGALIRRAGCRIIQVPCRGRVVIDRNGMVQENPGYPVNSPNTYTQEQNGLDNWAAPDLDAEHFTDVDYMRMPPTVYGFTLAKKAWGELLVDNVSDIDFDTNVWDKLVLAPRTKRLIKGLVESHVAGGLVTDIIEGKGQGLIFLLHGSPGQGKTLTAEAIAEQLQRPLYSVGVGELGQEPNELETNLQSALNLAEAWNAILLLDEADVFLEQRSNHEMHRNACVAIFLRTLEFYSGILFLTTNRVASFDAAFHSRISLALRYPDLNETSRHAIWTQVLDRIHHGDHAAWADRIPLTDLVKLPLNGRRIKGVLRTAQAMAAHEQVPLALEHIDTVLELVRDFAEDLENSEETPNGVVARTADPGLVPQMLVPKAEGGLTLADAQE